MRSIRWSLILYFLVLLGAALGAVSLFVYQTTRHTLVAKQQADEELRRKQYAEQQRDIAEKLDDELKSQAKDLWQLVKLQFPSSRLRQQALSQVSLMVSAFAPSPAQSAPGLEWRARLALFLMESKRGPIADKSRPLNASELQIDESEMTDPAELSQEYFQVNCNMGNTRWHSLSMGDLWFEVYADDFKKMPEVLDWKAEDKELKKGSSVRCVSLTVPVLAKNLRVPTRTPRGSSRFDPVGRFNQSSDRHRPGDSIVQGMRWDMRPDRRDPPPPPDRRDPPPEGREPPERPNFFFLIQCASDTHDRDEQLALLHAGFLGDLERMREDSRATLASLGTRLMLISLSTFAAVLLGGFLLVRLGLSPLHRLSEAVSRVSAKDFQLPFDEPRLPFELRPIVARLTETLALLKRAFAREKQAAADISHELRTPLAALLTTTEVALRKTRSPEEYRESLEDCRATGIQMKHLVEKMLALARLDAGVDTLRAREVDVGALAEQCIGLVKPLAEAKQLSLSVFHDDSVRLTTDADKMREVLTNLLHNAIQYNRPHGSIDVTVARHNGTLEVQVRDTGIGIGPEAQEHIFERFYRADPSRQADSMHAGLGLAIVKGYVDLMGGSITVESEEGQGSTFRIKLPVKDVHGASRQFERVS